MPRVAQMRASQFAIERNLGGFENLVEAFAPKEQRPDAWDLEGLRGAVSHQFGIAVGTELRAGEREALYDELVDAFQHAYDAKRQAVGPEVMPQLERTVLLSIMDAKWKDHLYMMDALREGIGLRAYGQRDPVVEYQREGYRMFQDMIESIKLESLTMLLRVQPVAEARPVTTVFAHIPQQAVHPEASSQFAERFSAPAPSAAPSPVDAILGPSARPAAGAPPRSAAPPPQAAGPKVGRNEPCPCGSGRKYKKCHGK